MILPAKIKWILIPILVFANLSGSSFAEFSDINSGHKHFVAINYLEAEGIVNGYEDGTFRSHNNINRAEALKMIMTASGTEFSEETPEEAPFTDTPRSAWYTPYLAAAKEQGIIDGYEDGSFHPEQTINKVEALKILIESKGINTFPEGDDFLYADTPADAWFSNYIRYAHARGLLEIQLDNLAHPDYTLSRGELAEIIYRQSLSEKGFQFGKATYYGKAVQGNGTASGETFDLNLPTAAHKTLPLGTTVKVTNLANNLSVTVKINDRGPYGAGRILDLSSSAFAEIASLSAGVVNIQYEVVGTE